VGVNEEAAPVGGGRVVEVIERARSAQLVGCGVKPRTATGDEAIERALARARERVIDRAIERARRAQQRRLFLRG